MNIAFITSSLMFEIIGYLGSIFVLISFLLKDIKGIRLVNIIGAVFFIIYGIATNTMATVFLNIALIVVHIIYLLNIYKKNKIAKIYKSNESQSLL